MSGLVVLGQGMLAETLVPMVASAGFTVEAVYDRDQAKPGYWPDAAMHRSLNALSLWVYERLSPHRDVERSHAQEEESQGWERFLGGPREAGGLRSLVALAAPLGGERLHLQGWMSSLGIEPAQLVHGTAHVESGVTLGRGVLVMAQALVMAGAKLGDGVLVHEQALVAHGNRIEDGATIGPGAKLCGCVTVGERAWVATGAIVLPGLRIGADAVVGAGAVVTRDVAPGVTVTGMPAQMHIKRAVADQALARAMLTALDDLPTQVREHVPY